MNIKYGDKIEVWTFTGWELFDWDCYESEEDLKEAFESLGEIRKVDED